MRLRAGRPQGHGLTWRGNPKRKAAWFESGSAGRDDKARSASPVRMVKPALVEPKFPTVQAHTRRSIPEAATPSLASCTQRLVKALCGEYLGMNRVRKRTGHLHVLARLTWAKAGSPVRREPHGDGVPIVAQCSGQRLRQDEGEQAEVFLPEREQVVQCVNPAQCSKGWRPLLESRVRGNPHARFGGRLRHEVAYVAVTTR